MAIADIKGEPHAYQLTPLTPSSTSVLVFVHGWLLSSCYWKPLLNILTPEFQCLTYDLRGFGDSQKKPLPQPSLLKKGASCYTLSAYAQDLSILLEQLEIESAWLVGHSLGGSIALWGADHCPERVKGVICLNSGGGIYLREEFERFRSAGQQLVKHRPQWLSYLPFLDWVFARAMVAHPLGREWGKQRVSDWLRADTEAALGTLLDSTTEEEVHLLPQVVSRLKQPVYFVAGEKDTVMETKYVRHLASFHSLFQACADNVIEIPECGHMSMVEKPHAIAQEIKAIIQNNQS